MKNLANRLVGLTRDSIYSLDRKQLALRTLCSALRSQHQILYDRRTISTTQIVSKKPNTMLSITTLMATTALVSFSGEWSMQVSYLHCLPHLHLRKLDYWFSVSATDSSCDQLLSDQVCLVKYSLDKKLCERGNWWPSNCCQFCNSLRGEEFWCSSFILKPGSHNFAKIRKVLQYRWHSWMVALWQKSLTSSIFLR